MSSNTDTTTTTIQAQPVKTATFTNLYQPKQWHREPSTWNPLIHTRADEIIRQNDEYFIKNWPFPSNKDVQRFVKAGFGRVTCFYFPLAKDDRILFACKLLTVLFLIDDLLEDMSFEEGEAYNAKLIPMMRGEVLPDRTIPVEYINYDLWAEMRAHDKELADEILEPTFTFMRAQTDKSRIGINKLGHYLEYREKDVGKALLSALMRFSMAIHLKPAELQALVPLERNCSKHISVVNDIFSWEKELKASQAGHQEGSALCSAVQVVSNEANLGIPGAKRVLWAMVNEWELVHDQLVEEMIVSPGGCCLEVKKYMKGLEYQMSGNEKWSKTTKRYIGIEV